jgi:hypothetical protein
LLISGKEFAESVLEPGTLHDPEKEASNIVVTTALSCCLHQTATGLFQIAALNHNVQNLIILQVAGESIRGHQQDVTREHREIFDIGFHSGFCAQSAKDYILQL